MSQKIAIRYLRKAVCNFWLKKVYWNNVVLSKLILWKQDTDPDSPSPPPIPLVAEAAAALDPVADRAADTLVF
jgi:hypothetical protein